MFLVYRTGGVYVLLALVAALTMRETPMHERGVLTGPIITWIPAFTFAHAAPWLEALSCSGTSHRIRACRAEQAMRADTERDADDNGYQFTI